MFLGCSFVSWPDFLCYLFSDCSCSSLRPGEKLKWSPVGPYVARIREKVIITLLDRYKVWRAELKMESARKMCAHGDLSNIRGEGTINVYIQRTNLGCNSSGRYAVIPGWFLSHLEKVIKYACLAPLQTPQWTSSKNLRFEKPPRWFWWSVLGLCMWALRAFGEKLARRHHRTHGSCRICRQAEGSWVLLAPSLICTTCPSALLWGQASSLCFWLWAECWPKAEVPPS